MPEITWVKDLEEACERAKRERKLILLDFFSPA
jgi:hypothetical protein